MSGRGPQRSAERRSSTKVVGKKTVLELRQLKVAWWWSDTSITIMVFAALGVGICAIALAGTSQNLEGSPPALVFLTALLSGTVLFGVAAIIWWCRSNMGTLRVVIGEDGRRKLMVVSRSVNLVADLPAEELVCGWTFTRFPSYSSTWMHRADILVMSQGQPILHLQARVASPLGPAGDHLGVRPAWAYGRVRAPKGCPRVRVWPAKQRESSNAEFMARLEEAMSEVHVPGNGTEHSLPGSARSPGQQPEVGRSLRLPAIEELVDRVAAVERGLERTRTLAQTRRRQSAVRRWTWDRRLELTMIVGGAMIATPCLVTSGPDWDGPSLGLFGVALGAVSITVAIVGVGLLVMGKRPSITDPAGRSLSHDRAEVHRIKQRRAQLEGSTGTGQPNSEVTDALARLDARLEAVDAATLGDDVLLGRSG